MSADELYAVIEKIAVDNHALLDEYGFFEIPRQDVITDGSDRFVIQFRRPYAETRVESDCVVDATCRKLKCEKEFYVKIEREYGIPFLDCSWILDLTAKVEWGDDWFPLMKRRR